MTSRRVFLLGILLLAVLAVPASAQDAAGAAGGDGQRSKRRQLAGKGLGRGDADLRTRMGRQQ